MKSDWENIKEQIHSTKTDLSPDLWNRMEGELDRGKDSGKWRMLGLLFLISLITGAAMLSFASAGILKLQNTDKAYYLPREGEADNFSNEPTVDQSQAGSIDITESNEVTSASDEKAMTSGVSTSVTTGGAATQSGSTYSSPAISQNNNEEEGKGEAEEIAAAGKPLSQQPSTGINPIVGTDSTEAMLDLSEKFPSITKEGVSLEMMSDDTYDIQLFDPLEKDKWRDSRFELRLSFGLNYSQVDLEYAREEGKTHREFDEATDDAVSPGLGFDGQAELRYALSKNFKLSGGFGFRRISTQSNYNFVMNYVPVILEGQIVGYLDTPSTSPVVVNTSQTNTYSYLKIPLSLNYEYPLSSKWSLTGEFINEFSFLVGQSSDFIDPTRLDVQAASDDLFNPLLVSYQLRLGLRYQLNKNTFLALEPSYRSNYNDLYRNESVSWKPRDLSLNLTAIIKLKY